MYFKSKLEPLSIRKLLKVHFDDKLAGQWRTSERWTSVYRAPERRRRRVFTRFLGGDPVVFVSAGRCGGCGGGNPVGGWATGRAPDDNNNNNGTDGTARSVVPGRNDETLYGDVPVHVLRATKVAVQRCPNPLLPRLLTGRTLLGASYAYCTVRLRGTRSAAVAACPTRSHVRIPATIAVSTITSSTNCRTCWFTKPLFTQWRT